MSDHQTWINRIFATRRTRRPAKRRAASPDSFHLNVLEPRLLLTTVIDTLTNPSSHPASDDTNWIAQSFIPTHISSLQTFTLDSITIFGRTSSGTGAQLQIFDDSAITPGTPGTPIATLTGTDFASFTSQVTFTPTTPPTVNANTTYHAVFAPTGGSHTIGLRDDTTNPLTWTIPDEVDLSTDAGSTWINDAASDAAALNIGGPAIMTLQVEATLVPETSVTLNNGILTITDIAGGDTDDQIFIQQSGGN